MPIHRVSPAFDEVRARVHGASTGHELVIVLNHESLAGVVEPRGQNERVVSCARRGRGYALACGVAESRGDIVLLLHGDTLLPAGWDGAILGALSDRRVVGGGFRLAFDRPSVFLDFTARITDFFDLVGGAMWGDRALFGRAGAVKKCLPELDVPFFEDVRLSKALRQMGKLTLLDEKVITGTEHFRRYGPFKHCLRILKARAWYATGVDPQKIYDYYYSRGSKAQGARREG
ncbi:MAG: hypothetical protein FJ149_10185 [Euryarchaeota archaeon]|nr:hypothetical protein [Euryarchaeota archaeon]